MQSFTARWFFEMAGIPSVAFVFDDDLATELETYANANVELFDSGNFTCLTRSVIFSNTQHYAIYMYTIALCHLVTLSTMPSICTL